MLKKPFSFTRFRDLIGETAFSCIQEKVVLVLGCGGVGGFVIESLVRSGIRKIILVDFDIIEESNLNRQIIALHSTIGKKKVDVFESRIHDINPECEVVKIDQFINEDNISLLFSHKIDFFVDACDFVPTKKRVILECVHRKIPFISSMGTAKKMDPSKLEIIEIKKTSYDPLAKIIRKFVRDENIQVPVMVLSSSEKPYEVETLGSCSFVPSVGGLLITSYVIHYFLDRQ